MSINLKMLYLMLYLGILFRISFSQSTESVKTNDSHSLTNFIAGKHEFFHLFFALNTYLWLIFLLIIFYGLYESISNSCLLKSILIGGRSLQTSHTFTITVIASDPSVAYDYDNSSIRIELNDKNDESIASLMMRPLWAFHMIQQKPNPISITSEKKTTEDSTVKTINLSREVPLIGIYKLITDKNLNKIHKIVLSHNCPHPSASILVRCIEISNITSLISHTYPLNANIPYLTEPIDFLFDSSKCDFEFDSSDDFQQKIRFQLRSPLNLVERGSLWLLSFNIIFGNSYFWSKFYKYESRDEWFLWENAVIVSLFVGSFAAFFHLIISFPYRLFKEYFFYHKTTFILVIKIIIILMVNLISLTLLISHILIAYQTIRSTILFRWYRIAFLSTLVFIGESVVLSFICLFIHIKPKPINQISSDDSSLEIPKIDENRIKYELIEQNCSSLEIKNIKSLQIFASDWVRLALIQHKGLDSVILCDIYDVMLLPKVGITTNLAENAVKLFGEQNGKENASTAYATKMIQQKGMAVSVSQYGRKRKEKEQKDTNTSEEVIEFENN